MAARIRSTRNYADPVSDASRDDLVPADIVTVQAIDAATTYQWSLAYVPAGSTAVFSGSSTAVSPGTFTVDLVGAYLVRLVVDAGLGSEDEQYVRLRALTSVLGLKLVAAGERRDASGVVPVDADVSGWADEQNNNLQLLEAASSVRVFESGSAITTGDVVAFDTTVGGGHVIRANATRGAPVGVSFANGIATSTVAGAGLSVQVAVLAGGLTPATFAVAPAATDQGKPVYLHTVSGQVSLTAPSGAGTDVVRVGILQDASTNTVQFLPQFIASIP